MRLQRAFILNAAFLCCLQLKRLSAAVGFGGGRSLLLEEGSLPRELLESPQSCVIDMMAGSSQALVPSSSTEWAKSVKNVIQRSAQYCIRESLLMLSVLTIHFCLSSEKACESLQSLKLD